MSFCCPYILNLIKCKFLLCRDRFFISHKFVWRQAEFAFLVRDFGCALFYFSFFILRGIFMDIFRVSFIGHRQIERLISVERKVEEIVRDLIKSKQYVEFLIGRSGEFDISCASAVKRAQKALGHENSSLILVLPYHVKDEEYYEKYYDEIYMPIDPKTHYKSAITKRNKWMVENSDLLIAHVNKDIGGAHSTLKYAEKIGVPVINVELE